MTNPWGYYHNYREELLPNGTFQDINRDFPYLVEQSRCMQTIGARVINELFINHVFSLALTLHGGVESLTYPYGAPNHIEGGTNPIEMNYVKSESNKKGDLTNKKGDLTNNNNNNNNISYGKSRVIPKPGSSANETTKNYRNGKFDNKGKSTEAPDFNALSSLAQTASSISGKPGHQYDFGDMSDKVYPVTGGMEDWAYAASWEGKPVITEGCNPSTYDSYDVKKTQYGDNYKDALKCVMFLLEISDDKKPQGNKLGRKTESDECILGIHSNAFNIFNTDNSDGNSNSNKNKNNNIKECLDLDNDGYVNRVLRLSLTMIDLLSPYIIGEFKLSNKHDVNVRWTVGGAIDVDETFMLYNFVDKSEYTGGGTNSEDVPHDSSYFKNKSEVLKGKAVWNLNFEDSKDMFELTVENKNNKKYLEAIVFAKVDGKWFEQDKPIPRVMPQTHLVNLRRDSSYRAKNGKFEIFGKEYFNSQFYLIEIK